MAPFSWSQLAEALADGRLALRVSMVGDGPVLAGSPAVCVAKDVPLTKDTPVSGIVRYVGAMRSHVVQAIPSKDVPLAVSLKGSLDGQTFEATTNERGVHTLGNRLFRLVDWPFVAVEASVVLMAPVDDVRVSLWVAGA